MQNGSDKVSEANVVSVSNYSEFLKLYVVICLAKDIARSNCSFINTDKFCPEGNESYELKSDNIAVSLYFNVQYGRLTTQHSTIVRYKVAVQVIYIFSEQDCTSQYAPGINYNTAPPPPTCPARRSYSVHSPFFRLLVHVG